MKANKMIEQQIRDLADQHGITAERDRMGRMAQKITELSGDDVALDEVEQLIVNLAKSKVISNREALDLQLKHLNERAIDSIQ